MRQGRRLIGQIRLIGLIWPMRLIRLMSPICLICLIGPIALLSCSSGSGGEDWEPVLPEEQGKPEEPAEMLTPISFSGSEDEGQEVNMVKKDAATRTATSLSLTATAFKVWGYKNMTYNDVTGAYDTDASKMQTVFPGYTVNWIDNSAATTTTNSSGWEYVGGGQTIKFWDWSAAAYRFCAVTGWEAESNEPPYEANKAYGASETYETYQAYRITMMADATSTVNMDATPYFSHLWFSTGQLPTYADKQFGRPVQLEFLKPYTRVRFLFKYTFPREGIVLTDKSFKPTDNTGIIRKGTVTIHYPLTGTATREWLTTVRNSDPDPAVSGELVAFTEDHDPEDDSKVYTQTDNGWYVVLPNQSQGSYTLNVTINNTPKTATVPAEYMQWLPGYSYTYVFKILDQGGVEIDIVESAVTPWTEIVTTHTVFNW